MRKWGLDGAHSPFRSLPHWCCLLLSLDIHPLLMGSWHGWHEIILRRLDEKGPIHLTESRINRALSSGIGVHSTKLIIHSVCCNPSDRIVLRFYEHLWTSTADAPKICLGAPKICVSVRQKTCSTTSGRHKLQITNLRLPHKHKRMWERSNIFYKNNAYNNWPSGQ